MLLLGLGQINLFNAPHPSFQRESHMKNLKPILNKELQRIEKNALLMIHLEPRDFEIQMPPTSKQDLLLKYAAKALVLEGVANKTHCDHLFTTLAYCIMSESFLSECQARFVPKLLMTQEFIRKKGLWEAWDLVKDSNNQHAEIH